MKNSTVRWRLAVMICSVATLSACTSVPREIPTLEQARHNYIEASENRTVVKHAPDEIDKAGAALKRADSLWEKKGDRWQVEHHAYMVQKHVETANLIAQSNETDRELETMELARRNVALNLREAELNQARQRTLELERQMKELQAEKTERGMVLTLGDVLFDVDKASLAPGAAHNIRKIAAFMRSYPERKAVIEGHTDSIGEEDYNMDLSRERAVAVRNALVSAGISGGRISTKGFGETLPVANNASASGRQENRRVEIIFPDDDTQVSEIEG